MTQSGLVSVIIPCYNAESFIKETIDSVLKQTYPSIEIIVINDGSTDRTQKVLTYLDRNIPTLQVVHVQNGGVSKARNIGVEYSKGEYIGFLDADDLYLPDNILRKVKALENAENTLLVHSYERIFESKTKTVIDIAKGQSGHVLNTLLSLEKTVIHSPSSVLITKSLYQSIGGFDQNLSTSADWEFWVRAAKKTPFSVIKEPLSMYRIHENQMHSNIDLMKRDMLYAFKKHKNDGSFQSIGFYKKCSSKLNLTIGLSYMGDGKKYKKGIIHLMKSIVLNPIPITHWLLVKTRLRS